MPKGIGVPDINFAILCWIDRSPVQQCKHLHALIIVTITRILIHPKTAQRCTFWLCLSATLVRHSRRPRKAAIYKFRIELERSVLVKKTNSQTAVSCTEI